MQKKILSNIHYGLFLCVFGILSCFMISFTTMAADSDFKTETLDDDTLSIVEYLGTDTEIVFPSTIGGVKVTNIGAKQNYYQTNIFNKLEPTKITIPEGIVGINNYAFSKCKKLSDVVFPSTLDYISTGAFFGCESLKSVSLPDNCTTVGWNSFSGCTSLSSVKFGDGLTKIGATAFEDCSNLTDVTLPKNLNDYSSSFSGCTGLKSVTISEGVTLVDSAAFVGCTNLETVTLPSTISVINAQAFKSSGIKEITIPDGVKVIEGQTFFACSNLESITIPDSVTEIKSTAFDYCKKLSTVYTIKDCYADTYAKSKKYKVVYIEKKEESKDDSSEEKKDTEISVGTELTIEESKCKVKVVSNDKENPTVSFSGTVNNNAKTVSIPDIIKKDDIVYKVVKVDNKALAGNKKVTKIVIGKNVVEIGNSSFEKCTNLKTVDVKSTVLNKIGANAFNGDKKLTKITLKTSKLTKKSIGKNIIKGTNKKLVIKVPKKKVKVYKKYFKNKGNKNVKVTK